MEKTYNRINWLDSPNDTTPLNAVNLNKVDYALDAVDDRVVELSSGKLDQETGLTLVKDFNYDDASGTFTITKLNGVKKSFNTGLEKAVINFDYDSDTQSIIMYLEDGTTKNIDLSDFVTELEFEDTDTIDFSVVSHKVKAIIPDGAVTESKINSTLITELRTSAASATSAATVAQNALVDIQAEVAGVEGTLEEIDTKLSLATFTIDNDGNLIYTDNSSFNFGVDENGILTWEVVA